MDTPPKISVVIPTKDRGWDVQRCLDGIRSQTLADAVEIIVIDSGSAPETLALLRRSPVKLHCIQPEEFNHGETRNLGVRLALGEFVVMSVQDAWPVDDRWLERMLAHFADPNVGGVCGQQVVPHEPDKNPLQWFRPYSQPAPEKIQFANPADFQQLPPAEQAALCSWDDVTAMYRRSVLRAIPFQRVDFSEDGIWARDALLRGQALVYDYSARVYHYHSETFSFRFRRTFTILYHLQYHFAHIATPAWLLPRLARQIFWSAQRKYCPQNRLCWCGYNVRLTLAEWLAGWYFWLAFKLGGKKMADRAHTRLCARPPQPVRATS